MMWLAVVVVVVTAATAEKLGDIEVITRGELGQDGLVPPTRISTLVPVKATPPHFIQVDAPLPPLSYVPPIQTLLPIEPTPAPQVVPPDTLYEAPNQTPPLVPTPVSPPTGLYVPPTPQVTAGGDNVPVGVAGTGGGGSTGDSYGYEETYVEEPVDYVGGDGDFITSFKDSKFALLGGVIGAKVAVAEGFKNAKDTLFSGITRSIVAKNAAFSNLKDYDSGGGNHHYGPHEEDNYGGSSEGDVVGLGGSGGSGSVVGGRPIYPNTSPPITPYPIYPPYPQPIYPKPVYPMPVYPVPVHPFRPSYRPKPNPMVGLKAKVASLVQAKKEALTIAVAKAKAIKEGIKSKMAAIFHKGGSTDPTYYPTYYPTRPTYPTSHGLFKPKFVQQKIEPEPFYFPSEYHQTGYKAFGKPKTPFYGFQPVYGHSYGRRPW